MMRRLKFIVFGLCLLIAACAPDQPQTQSESPSGDVRAFPAPDFTLERLDGNTLTLSNLRGRWVIVNFWATWCEPCVVEMPALQSIASNYRSDLILLGINMRETVPLIRPFVEAQNLTFPILLDPSDELLAQYAVRGLPKTMVISPDGDVVWQQFGPVELESFEPTLQRLLAEAA
ncbi:MAG: TlpA family protein disulfide reductase [Chloroflexi bacterium]|nr:TlpA family protein disulfide reductase [Chloroflexota bacterium]